MKISTSAGISEFDTIEIKTVEDLGKVALLKNISTSVFKSGKRNIENFEFADCVGLDIDNDKKGTNKLLLSEAIRIFSPYKHLILASRNHNEEKNGIVAERFRVILFPEWQITDSKDFYSTWFWLKDQFPWIDNQCKDPSRFWYQHKSILSFKEDGKLIPVIKYTEPVKTKKELKAVNVEDRGKLSTFVLNFLEFGVEAGSRNGTVYKVAREFQQALYDHEEAETRILHSLERNNVISDDFTESEAKLAIRSAFSKDAKHAPRIADEKPRAFQYHTLAELLQTDDSPEDWLIQNLLLKGGVSAIVGMPKIGKSTLIRQMERCVLRGTNFLGRIVKKGTVVHYSFDEKARTAKKHYVKLGLNKTDSLTLHFGGAYGNNYLKDFEEDVLSQRPALVVVDTLFDLVDSQDVNNYGIVKKQLSFFNALAEKSGSHIMFIHHTNKPNQNYTPGSGHNVLGSTAIFGSVDCLIIFEQVSDTSLRTLAVKGRAVEDFETIELKFNKNTMVYEIAVKSNPHKTEDFF